MVLLTPASMVVVYSIPLPIAIFVLLPTKTSALSSFIHVRYIVYVHATSDSVLNLSDKEGIESAEFPVYSVQKPGLVVVSGKTDRKSVV